MDVEWTDRGAARTIDDWRTLFPVVPVETPTYAADVTGPLLRFDERDTVFARRELQPGTPEYAAYYSAHPERKAIDDEFRALPYLAAGEPPRNAGYMRALFDSAYLLGTEAAVRGEARPVGLPSQPTPVDPVDAARRIKAFARALGADLVGIGPLNQAFVYTNLGRPFHGQHWGEPIVLGHRYAISLGIRMNTVGLVRTAPAFSETVESGLAYARGALISVQLAIYLRSLGYSARAHHFRNYQVLAVPVAVDGGLGELARCGFLLTQEYGNCLRLATVTTDLEVALDSPVNLGVQQFCDRCVICAKACPARAIPEGPKTEVRGVRKWALDAERCYRYWHEVGSDCGICIAVCPWSRWTLGPRPQVTEEPVPGSFYCPTPRPDWLR